MPTEISKGKEHIEMQASGAGFISSSFDSEAHIKAGCSSGKYIEVAVSAQEEL